MTRPLTGSIRRTTLGVLGLAAVAVLALPLVPAQAVSGPTIDSIRQPAGSTAGGSFTIIGTNLLGTTEVDIDGVAVRFFTIDTSRRVSVVAPPHAAGAVDIRIVTADGEDTLIGGFTYADAPTISQISVASGPWRGGTTVSITGTNLTGALKVSFGRWSAASLTVVSDSQVDVVTPTGWGRNLEVAIDTPGGTATEAGAWTYISPPTEPQNLRVTDRGVRTLTLAWDRPDFAGGSTVSGYVVAYRPANVRDWSGRRLAADARGVTLHNLTPGAIYVVRVAAITGERGGFAITGAKVLGPRPSN